MAILAVFFAAGTLFCGPRFLLAWLRASASEAVLRFRRPLASMPSRTRRVRRRRLRHAQAQSLERCDLTPGEWLEFRRITGRIANGVLAESEGRK
jgi:hypothetical protein